MILLSLTCAVLAVLAFVPRAASAAMDARLTILEGAGTRTHRRWWYVGLAVLAVSSAGALGSLAGGRGAAIALATAIAVGTGWRLLSSHARMRAVLEARRCVSEACAALAAQVRIGRLPADALTIAAEDCHILRSASSVQALGGDVVAVWGAQSRQRGHGGLAELGRAWRISTQIGAPMTAALERLAEGLAAEESVQAVVAAELAGPRATGTIMAFLPLAGVALGYALGGNPIDFLLQDWLGWICLVGGVGLAATGVLWVESLAQRVATQA
jgi:tight adherence protein B